MRHVTKQTERPYLIRKGDRLYDTARSLEDAIARIRDREMGRGLFTVWLRGELLHRADTTKST